MKKVLLIRPDNIGDVLYALPSAAFIKQHWPDCRIYMLARNYVQAMVVLFSSVDGFIDWEQLRLKGDDEAALELKQYQFDACIHLLPKQRIAKLCKKANIPLRIGTLRRLYNLWTCNRRVNLSRRRSTLHEAQLNACLLKGLRLPGRYSLQQCQSALKLIKQPLSSSTASFLRQGKFNLIIHPGTDGHTLEWSPDNFLKLIKRLPKDKFHVLLTGSKDEAARFKDTLALHDEHVTNTMGQLDLEQFINLIQHCDGLVANATGPLHVAAACGLATVGLYPRALHISPSRWGAFGAKANNLVAKRDGDDLNHPGELLGIDVDEVYQILRSWA